MRLSVIVIATIISVYMLPLPQAVAAHQCSDGRTIISEKELVINQPHVLAGALSGPGGPWHISSLMRNMLPAGSSDKAVSDFIQSFLVSFTENQSRLINPARPAGPDNPRRELPSRLDFSSLAVRPWIEKSMELVFPDQLALAYAPFKLVAIVNRLDARDPAHCASSAGEGRFVFAALSRPTSDPQTAPDSDLLPFTMILEYSLPTTRKDARDWARAWHALGGIPCAENNCTAFTAALKDITDEFSLRNLAPGRPAGNPLNQVRTNEIFSFPGDMREFHLAVENGNHVLTPVPVSRNPLPELNGSESLAAFVFTNKPAVLSGRFGLPAALQSFTGTTLNRQKWTFANIGGLGATEFEDLRFTFSKNTCDGCHSHEHPRIENVDGVYHVAPDGRLSGYLTDEALPERAELLCKTLAVQMCNDSQTEVLDLRKAGIH